MRRLALLIVLLLPVVATAAAPATPLRLPPAARVVVTADVHGAYDDYRAILRETGVIDAGDRWSGGQTQLVSLGDLLDRGAGGRAVLDLLMRLEGEARQAGGGVHTLLGNHEVMNLVGDLRYVSREDYAAFAGDDDTRLRNEAWQRVLAQQPAAQRAEFDGAYPPGYFAREQAFSPQGRYGAWLLSRPFLMTIGDTAFVHGGLPPLVAELGLDKLDAQLHTQLDEYLGTWSRVRAAQKLARPVDFLERPGALAVAGGEAASKELAKLQDGPLFSETGPTWYRGQAVCYPLTEEDNLEAALAKLGVARVIIGHTPTSTKTVLSRFDGRVIELDTGMLKSAYGGRPSAYMLENGQWRAAYADKPGERIVAVPPPRMVGARPGGLDDDALERWLTEAEIVKVEDLDTGVTKPRRLTLRKDGIEMRAVFKDLSVADGASGSQRSEDVSDRYEYDVAAYKLDRLLGLDMVPVTVVREVNGKRGAAQLWVEDSLSLARMVRDKVSPAGQCPIPPQYYLMNAFDVLTFNTDRNQGNALFTKDWMLILIDHTRGFRLGTGLPPLLYKGGLSVTPALAERLMLLTPSWCSASSVRISPSARSRRCSSVATG